MRRLVVPILVCAIALTTGVISSLRAAPKGTDHPILITWQNSFNVAVEQSQRSGKPVMAILQSTPDCANCQALQRDLAAHPLLAEAVAEEFIALKLDRRHDRSSATASQHLLFLDTAMQPIATDAGPTPSPHTIAVRMIQALEAVKRPVPNYLHAASMELETAKHKQAAFAMFCYWVGEYELGKIDGVVATEAGWLEGREVTLVRYHQDRLALPELARKAAEVKCARKVFAPTEAERREISDSTRLTVGTLDDRYRIAKPSDQKKQIESWDLSGVSGLTSMQLTKINALAPDSPKHALAWLSPRQRREFAASLQRRR